ncbi:MAG: polyprenol monophosphomannose synthase [FCB group bacterium]|nr:polyprenol monophosphomannose synthase [FCB group bacterium]
MKTLIITPTYNERKNIADLIKHVFTVAPRCHILVVDDNSPDGTAEVVKELQKRYSHLFLEQRPGKAGLGKAYCHGFKWALKRDYEAIVQIDADLSHDPADIPAMLRLLDDYDLVIGSRYCDGISVVRWPLRRLILSYGANLYTRLVTGLPIYDATGGFKAWRRKVLESIDLNSIRSEGYSFQIEMNFRAWYKGFRIKEHPIIFIDRTIGESKMSRSIMFEAVFIVWRLRIWKIFGWNK